MTVQNRKAVRDAILADPTAAVTAAVTTVAKHIPAYQVLDRTQQDELFTMTAWGIKLVLDGWADGRRLTDQDLAQLRRRGAKRALDGIPLAAVQRLYRLTSLGLTDYIIATWSGSIDGPDALALQRTLLVMIDQLAEAATAGYLSVERQGADTGARAERRFLDDVITGNYASATAIFARAAQLGVKLPNPPRLLLLDVADPGQVITEVDVMQELAEALVTSRHGRVVALCSDEVAGAPSLPASLEQRGWRACLIASQPVAALATAYRLAAKAMELAPREAFGLSPLLHDADASVLALMHGTALIPSADVARLVLGELLDPANAHLLDGLATFLDVGSVPPAADRLGIHAQTLRYRLRRVRDLTGRDPRNPWHRLTLDIIRHLVRAAE